MPGLAPACFDDFYTPDALRDAFTARLARRAGRGIDGVSMSTFRQRLDSEVASIALRCVAGEYALAPYLQRLVSKSHLEPPRTLSIGTARDRLVLSQLHRYLTAVAPPLREQRLANQHIRDLIALGPHGGSGLWVLRADIRNFFPSISQQRVLAFVADRQIDDRAKKLLRRAIRNPTVPIGTSRSNRRAYVMPGVPQGVPFANYLANIYLSSFDSATALGSIYYDRYVDDLLIVGSADPATGRAEIEDRLSELELYLNPRKSPPAQDLSVPFDFLGYELSLTEGSARVSRRNCSTLIRSIAAIIARHERHLYSGIHQDERESLMNLAMEEINERITGARWGARTFGWMFYFSEVTDRGQLHALDAAVARLVRRSQLLGTPALVSLKSLVRTYHEIRARAATGYIMDYNAYRTSGDRRTLLVARRQVSSARAYLVIDEEIDRIFAAHVEQRLSRLERDDGLQYN